METLEFKTNIMCGSCVAKVTQNLNQAVGEENWKVDIQHPDKVLTVITNDLAEDDIIQAVVRAGYKAVKRSA